MSCIPSGRYDEDGNLYVDLGTDLLDSPFLPLARFALTDTLPAGAYDWEPFGDTLWIHWNHARHVERRLRQLWPGATVTAAANPRYQGQHSARTGASR